MSPLARIALAAAIAAACAPPGPALVFDTARGAVRFTVEISDTPATRERGLRGRAALAADAGMLFVWDEDTTASFWMKDTLIPLSIAFISAEGRVLRILELEPCRTDPCPVYDAGVAYRTALEVARGAFAAQGVRVGDRARLVG